MDRAKQTDVAAKDSRNVIQLGIAAEKRMAMQAFGNKALTVDLTMFISKCIRFTGPDSVPRASEDDDEIGTIDPDWNALGDLAFACSRRPAAPSFLLGPLSVEKRVRTTQRTARNRKEAPVPVTRPEELQAKDLERNENSNLTDLCRNIKERLTLIIDKGVEAVEQEDIDVESAVEAKELFRKHHLSTNYEVSLFEFAVNPTSFAQTIENIFYVSFLIRDGFVALSYDEDELPTLRKYHPSPCRVLVC
jgi:non-structural maintenance of chromosomes element 4